MAGASDAVSESGGEEGDYETDSDGTSTLALRRRAASDDEEDESGHRREPRVGEGAGGHLTQDAASSVDGESSRLPYSDEEDDDADDGEGAPPVYEEDEDEEELLLEEDEHQRDSPSRQLLTRRRKGSDVEEDDDDVGRRQDGDDGSVGGSKRGDSPEAAEGVARPGGKEVTEEEKKEAEPFVVPTAGAFYMHDDRFRDSGGARPRRGMGGRKLWEAKDEKPWVHDLYEEFNSLGHDHFADQGYPRGGRGRGRSRGRGRGRGRGGVGRVNDDIGGMRSRVHGRGRGSRRDAAESVREDAPSAANYAAKVLNEADAAGTDQSRSAQSIQQQENAAVRKASSGSYLNSASPPFIPSGVLQQKVTGRVDGPGGTEGSSGQIPSKGRDQYGVRNSFSRENIETAGVSNSVGGSGRGSVSGGSGLVWSQGDGALPTTVPQQAARPASISINQQQKQNLHHGSNPVVDSLAQQSGRGTAFQAQTASFVRSPQTQGKTQVSQQGQPATSNPRSSPQPGSGNAGTNSVVGSNNTRYKGNGGGRGARVGPMPVSGRGSYVFAGGPSAALRVGDPGFQPPPAVGPVAVQYGGQSPAGIGVPAVGMPIPNYPYGYPNPEVTWVPVLAGGGAIGGSYGSPYMMEVAPSHMYYTPATAQPATAYHLPGRDLNGAKHQPPGGLWKPPPSPELGTDEFGQRQSKPRRYSEMNFGQ